MNEFLINGTPVKIWAKVLDPIAYRQIYNLAALPFVFHHLAFMPDVHAGVGMPIGGVLATKGVVVPNAVGVDIGCGMYTVELGKIGIDFEKLDEAIRKNIPSGMKVHEGRIVRFPELMELKCYRELKDTKRLERSIGTLGGGNHFIEIDSTDEGTKYLLI